MRYPERWYRSYRLSISFIEVRREIAFARIGQNDTDQFMRMLAGVFGCDSECGTRRDPDQQPFGAAEFAGCCFRVEPIDCTDFVDQFSTKDAGEEAGADTLDLVTRRTLLRDRR